MAPCAGPPAHPGRPAGWGRAARGGRHPRLVHRPPGHRRTESRVVDGDEHLRGPCAGLRRQRGPKIVTRRFGDPESHTLERYLATDGYEGLRKALTMAPADVANLVKDAVLLGRGGAGFPAGVKWGFMPPGVAPLPRGQRRRVRARHLQGPPPDGARPAPAHRGLRHRLLRPGSQPVLPLRAGRDGPGPGAHRPGPQRRLRRRLRREEHPRHRLLASTWCCTGVPAPTSWARRRRSSRASKATGACPGSSPRSSRRPRAST